MYQTVLHITVIVVKDVVESRRKQHSVHFKVKYRLFQIVVMNAAAGIAVAF